MNRIQKYETLDGDENHLPPKMIEFKGICCFFSQDVLKTLNNLEEQQNLLISFFKSNSEKDIEWIPASATDETDVPVYTMSSALITVVIFPMELHGQKSLYIQNKKESPFCDNDNLN